MPKIWEAAKKTKCIPSSSEQNWHGSVAYCSLPVDDSDEDRYVATPRSPVPVVPQKRFDWLFCVKKQTPGEENPLFSNKVGASPSDLANSRVRHFSCSVADL